MRIDLIPITYKALVGISVYQDKYLKTLQIFTQQKTNLKLDEKGFNASHITYCLRSNSVSSSLDAKTGDESEIDQNSSSTEQKQSWLMWLGIAASVYLILVAVGMVGSGFKWASGGKEGAEKLFAFATNPFMGLIIGTLATALVQSSSTVTSVIVGLVAGGLPVGMAIPMIMGANIGTSVTNTLVSLGHAREKEEFKRAFSAATVHDFFNIMAVLIFLPLEMAFGFLEKTSYFLSQALATGTAMGGTHFNFIKAMTKPILTSVKSGLSGLPEPLGGILMIVLGVGLIILSITIIGKLLKVAMVGRAKKILHSAIGRGPLSGIASGTAVTVIVQSSSTTTSLAVPLAGAGVFSVKEIYPFTLGANIGTTITALVAALGVSGASAAFALQIALVHLLFNTMAVLCIFGLPLLRELPISFSEKLALVASERKAAAFAYIVGVFFALPGLAMAISQAI